MTVEHSWTPDEPRPEGRYRIYVNLYDACRQPSVRFAVSVSEAVGGEDEDEVKHLEQKRTYRGELLDFQANGGSDRGLFVAEYVFR